MFPPKKYSIKSYKWFLQWNILPSMKNVITNKNRYPGNENSYWQWKRLLAVKTVTGNENGYWKWNQLQAMKTVTGSGISYWQWKISLIVVYIYKKFLSYKKWCCIWEMIETTRQGKSCSRKVRSEKFAILYDLKIFNKLVTGEF